MPAKKRVHSKGRIVLAPQKKPGSPSDTARRRWRAALIVAAVLLAYSNSFSGPFLFDDVASVVENKQIREWWHLTGLVTSERELPVAGRPLVNASFALNYALGGLDVRGYHAWNLGVHLVCALLVFGIVRRTLHQRGLRARFESRALDLSFAVALLWALHPLNTEAVDYVTQRTETMMGAFFLATLYAAIRAGDGTSGWRWQLTSVVCCALGMACKETMVTAPIVVALYDRAFVFASIRETLRMRWRLYVGLAATWVVLVLLLLSGPRANSAGLSTGVSVWTYLLNQTVMIVRYLWLSVWPWSLVSNYGWPVPLMLRDVLPYALAVVALLAAGVLALFRWPPLGFAAAWFFLTLAPTSSVVPIATEVGAERRMYLPLIALTTLAVVGGAALWDRATATRGETNRLPMPDLRIHFRLLMLAAAVVLAWSTGVRNRDYRSALVLAQTSVDRYPTSVGHHVLATELVAAGRRDEAKEHLALALPGAPRAYYTLGVLLLDEGRRAEAIQQFRRFIERQPYIYEAVSARQAIGMAFAGDGRWDEAAQEYRTALAMNPLPEDELAVRLLLGEALRKGQRYDEAIEQYRAYLQVRPEDVVALTGGAIALGATGRLDLAMTLFQRAAAAAPGDGAVQRNLANAMLDAGRPAEAVAPAQRAVALRPADAGSRDALARALRESRGASPHP